jgi:hypothetical protein
MDAVCSSQHFVRIEYVRVSIAFRNTQYVCVSIAFRSTQYVCVSIAFRNTQYVCFIAFRNTQYMCFYRFPQYTEFVSIVFHNTQLLLPYSKVKLLQASIGT